ncbi:MAG: type II secretion system major pseudopilin GspG [Candidatus Hydrogenedentes bacterium]|nr:type II secretion system major pseudopilin GspG [Candidatus Hydrogenedentota bacterium]
MASRSNRGKEGFTLIELMVVLAILALLAAAILPNVVGKSDTAKQGVAKTDIAMIESLLDQFYLDMGRYPTTEEGLNALFTAPEGDSAKWKGPYSKKKIPADPWGIPYVYDCPGTHSSAPYEVCSYGRDKQEGGEGVDADIVSWDTSDSGR